ncbi:VOC family protein [Ruegeria sp. R13_0]|uniref:VOC family protein n=1 Tax=Ruegeria sp. R13_0 TaxID=2821099 RepID=UPI001ADB5512|nr:VOC family protein [Ruegeria sp. R13_0]MBO9433736.1 VOC family protein [Ruegeria sp. R13_0]
MQKVRTCLWFESGGADAANFYVSLLPDSRMETVLAPDAGEPVMVDFTLAGAPYQILNGGPHFKLTEAASITVLAKDQDEIDRLWAALTSDGGEEAQCGWLKDRWGVSWQIYPQVLLDMQAAKDQAAAERARQAMYKMNKIDISELEAAFAGS